MSLFTSKGTVVVKLMLKPALFLGLSVIFGEEKKYI